MMARVATSEIGVACRLCRGDRLAHQSVAARLGVQCTNKVGIGGTLKGDQPAQWLAGMSAGVWRPDGGVQSTT